MSPGCVRKHLALRRLDLQQPFEKKANLKILVRYQMVIGEIRAVANLAAFTSACPLFVAALRGACHLTKIRPVMPKRNSGTGFLAAEMKEYDA